MDWWHVTCAHCLTGDATCCQCGRSGVVTYWVAEKSCAWVWEFGTCLCAACQRLRLVRLALTRVA